MPEQRSFLIDALQDAIIQQAMQPVHSTITLEVHVVDEEAVAKAKADAKPAPEPYIVKCMFCHQPVKQCVCEPWAHYRQ